MKKWLIPTGNENVPYLIGESKTKPALAICEADSSWTSEDVKFITVEEVDSGNGIMVKVASLDEEARDSAVASKELELDWLQLRFKRDQLLTQSDFTQLEDAPFSSQEKSDWAAYRQALRDLPANTVDPKNPNFPNKPGA